MRREREACCVALEEPFGDPILFLFLSLMIHCFLVSCHSGIKKIYAVRASADNSVKQIVQILTKKELDLICNIQRRRDKRTFPLGNPIQMSII